MKDVTQAHFTAGAHTRRTGIGQTFLFSFPNWQGLWRATVGTKGKNECVFYCTSSKQSLELNWALNIAVIINQQKKVPSKGFLTSFRFTKWIYHALLKKITRTLY